MLAPSFYSLDSIADEEVWEWAQAGIRIKRVGFTKKYRLLLEGYEEVGDCSLFVPCHVMDILQEKI